MDDDNLFDDDDALDYILYEDVSKDDFAHKKSGCLALFILFLIPASLLKIWL